MPEPSLPEESIFGQAFEIESVAERAAFLDRACGNNPALRAEVEALLRAHEDSGELLDLRKNNQLTIDLPACEGPGTVIGPYKLLEQIGEGGMGTVWMAEQTEPIQRRVALKVIKEGMDSKQVLARFEAERQALALMDHPNIAKVHDAGRTSLGRPYFVMELVKGQPITKYCDEKRLEVRERLELFGDVCRAVQHAHQKGIIHRDLKPSNVLVAPYDGKPVVKVIDFGVAKATGQRLTDKTLFTGFGALVGTPEYMSPEQAEVNNQDIDTRSDIYSLGVLLYELLTGSTPLTRKRIKEAALLEVLRVIREEEPPKPSTRLSESKDSLPSISAQRQTEPAKLTKLVRGELDWIVMKALEKDRNRRYETANGFAQDVQRYLADETVLACPPSVRYRLRKFARRNRAAMLTTAAALALMVVAAAGIWGWQHQETLRRAEKNFHAELTRRGVETSLEQLPGLHRRALWTEAEALLDQAEKQLGPDGDAELRERLRQAKRDTAFLKRLDDIRLEKSVIVDGKWNPAAALRKYPDAFIENGLDILEGDPVELAAKLGASEVRDYMLAALDDWATAEDSKNSKRIMSITADATGQAWRRQLSAFRKDGISLAEVYDAIPENERTPAIICAVADWLNQLGQDGIGRLESGLRQYPGGFWLHFDFGNLQGKGRADTAIGAYRAALAIRPGAPAVLINLGNVLAQKKEYKAAVAEYKEASRLDPKLAAPHHALGNVLSEKKDYAVAIAEYEKAIRLDPNYAAPHYGLGNLLYDKREYDAAIAEYKQAIRLNLEFALPHNGLGNVWNLQKDYAAAIAEYKEAIRLDPEYAEPHNGLGNVWREKKDYAAAIAEYKEAIRLDPEYAQPHNGLGNVLYDKREYDAAIAEYKQAIRLNLEFALPHNGLGKLWNLQKDYAAAIAEYKEAIRLDPEYAEPHNCLGTVLARKKDYAAAMAEFKEAIRLDPKYASPHYGLGNVLLEKKDYAACIAEYKEAVSLDAKYALPHYGLGNVWHEKKDYAAAIAEYKEAIRLDPTDAPPHYGLGNVLLAKKEYDGAIAEFKEAIRLDPKWAWPHSNLGIALRHKKAYTAAIAEFKEAIGLDPGHAFAYANLALTYRQLGRFSESVSTWGQAAKLMPGDVRVQNELRLSTQWLALDQQLTSIRQGSDRPKTPADAVLLADLASQEFKKEYGLAVRLFAEAFAADAKLMPAHRYNAACAACLAAAGKGKDADKLDDKQRAELRHKALSWLRDDLEANRLLLASDANKGGPTVAGNMRHWLGDADFAGVRGPEALAKLPEVERLPWQTLWKDVADTLKQAQEKAAPKR